MDGIQKFIEILEKTKLKKTENVYNDGDRYCAIGAVCKELETEDDKPIDWWRMNELLGEQLPDSFFNAVTKVNDETCEGKEFKCVAQELRRFYHIY